MNDFVTKESGIIAKKHANHEIKDLVSFAHKRIKTGFNTVVIIDPTPNSETDVSIITESGKKIPAIVIHFVPYQEKNTAEGRVAYNIKIYKIDPIKNKNISEWIEMNNEEATIREKCFAHFGSQQGETINSLQIYAFNKEKNESLDIVYGTSIRKTIGDYTAHKKEGTFLISGQIYKTKNGHIFRESQKKLNEEQAKSFIKTLNIAPSIRETIRGFIDYKEKRAFYILDQTYKTENGHLFVKDQKQLSEEQVKSLIKALNINPSNSDFIYNVHPNSNEIYLDTLTQYIFGFNLQLDKKEFITPELSKPYKLNHLEGKAAIFMVHKKMSNGKASPIWWAMNQSVEFRKTANHLINDHKDNFILLMGNTKMEYGVKGPIYKKSGKENVYVPAHTPTHHCQIDHIINFVWGGQ